MRCRTYSVTSENEAGDDDDDDAITDEEKFGIASKKEWE
jgi:hypothetical protein